MDYPVMLLAIKGCHAEKIFDGMKTYEIRRQRPKLHFPARALLYAPGKGVLGECVLMARTDFVPEQKMSQWHLDYGRKYARKAFRNIADKAGLKVKELKAYLAGASNPTVLLVGHSKRYQRAVTLAKLRDIVQDAHFTAPQSWRYLTHDIANQIAGIGLREVFV